LKLIAFMSGDLDKVPSSPSSEYDDPTYVQKLDDGHPHSWQQSHEQAKINHPAPSENHQYEHASNTMKPEAALGVDHRLVPGLMQVYENMTVSKTPHNTRSSASALHGQLDAVARNAAPAVSSYYSSGPPHQFSYGNFIIPAPYPIPYSVSVASATMPQSITETTTPSDAASSTTSSTDQRPRRKRSKDGNSTSSAKRRKKPGKDNDEDKEGKTQDGRWTKRFTWPEELHRDFVAAVFDIGLKHATPSSVMEHMPSHEQITTERIKSHLQKYRLHRHKSKEEFMSCYDDMVQRLKKNGARGVASLSGGQAAGYVSYAVDTQPDPETLTDDNTKAKSAAIANPLSHTEGPQDGDTILTIPRLTEEEKNSALGTSLGYLLGLFFSLKRQLQDTRQPIRHPYPDPPHDASVIRHGSTSRNTLEAGSLMKREMESQMAFQNKMRALKQEELSKLAEIPGSAEGAHKMPAFPEAHSPTETQHPGEADELRPAPKARTTTEEEEFWNTTNFDGELFDFLME
jgi:SHAQKYF class myb-like DNA-binding protein